MDTPTAPKRSLRPSTNPQEPASMPPSEEDDFAAASHSTADYAQFMPPKKRHGPARRVTGIIVLIILIVAALAGAGFGVYTYLKNHKSTPKTTTSSSTQQQKTAPQPALSKTYTSSGFGLTFKYPDGWNVDEPSTGGILTARSPATQLKTADGQTVNGQIVFMIRGTTQPLNEFNAGAGLAVVTSQKITYTQPSSTQRGSTYLSFVKYASSANKGIDGIYITGDLGYQVDQNVPKTDVAKVSPIIDMTFVKCASSTQCSGDGTPITLAISQWNDTSFSNSLKAMFESLNIQ
jgi:hypothetical protein